VGITSSNAVRGVEGGERGVNGVSLGSEGLFPRMFGGNASVVSVGDGEEMVMGIVVR
jgi:hypothetical protein